MVNLAHKSKKTKLRFNSRSTKILFKHPPPCRRPPPSVAADMEPELRPLRLACSVHNYDWGKPGSDSLVAALFSSNSRSPADPGKPYAELWMGTHDSGPSFVVGGAGGERVLLRSWIRDHPAALGEAVLGRWGGDLPFLFKVHSVNRALSIQAHPDKKLAEKLHNMYPSIYKDPNHKPEMALAITQFEALCGFFSLEELRSVLQNVKEIVDIVGENLTNQLLNMNDVHEEKLKLVLQSIYTQLMSASKDAVSEAVSNLKNRLRTDNKVRTLTEKEQLALRLEEQYPADVGVLSAFFLNYMKLEPGEALYLDANEPHAYISGECIECMATSDNVVRAGLTPKLRDVQTLCSMLTYKQGLPDILSGIPLNQYTKRYSPPFDEFEVDHCSIPAGASLELSGAPGPSIFIVTDGEGTIQTGPIDSTTAKGDVFFVPAGISIIISASIVGIQLFKAGVNSRVFCETR